MSAIDAPGGSARAPQLGTLLRSSPRGRRLLVRTVLLVAAVRVALWTLPFPTVQRLVGRLARRSPNAKPLTPQLVDGRAMTVQLAARLVPGASCLTQALALQALLGRAATRSQLRIGVARSDARDFEAHAWLECDGRVVIGGASHERYVPLLTIEEDAR